MAIAASGSVIETLTYEAYLAEEATNRRYDIVDGARIFMASPTRTHQEIALNIAELLRGYQRATGRGRTIIAAFDVLIRRSPRLQVRQPDLLFISVERLAQNSDAHPLAVAPELVVEILSDSDRAQILDGKLADYVAVGVAEAWIVRPELRQAEILRLAPDGPSPVAAYDETQTLRSLAFPDLELAVADFFKP